MSPGGINYPHLKFHYHRLRHLIHLCTYHFCHRLFWNNIMFELLCLFLLINKILPATIFGNVSWPQSHASWFYATFDRGVDIVPVAFDSQNATTCRIGSIKTFNHDISRVEVLYVHTRNIYTKKQGDVPLWGDSIDMCTSAPLFDQWHTLSCTTQYLSFISFMCCNNYIHVWEDTQKPLTIN